MDMASLFDALELRSVAGLRQEDDVLRLFQPLRRGPGQPLQSFSRILLHCIAGVL